MEEARTFSSFSKPPSPTMPSGGKICFFKSPNAGAENCRHGEPKGGAKGGGARIGEEGNLRLRKSEHVHKAVLLIILHALKENFGGEELVQKKSQPEPLGSVDGVFYGLAGILWGDDLFCEQVGPELFGVACAVNHDGEPVGDGDSPGAFARF